MEVRQYHISGHILWGYSLTQALYRPYGRYLQFRYLKWPLNEYNKDGVQMGMNGINNGNRHVGYAHQYQKLNVILCCVCKSIKLCYSWCGLGISITDYPRPTSFARLMVLTSFHRLTYGKKCYLNQSSQVWLKNHRYFKAPTTHHLCHLNM